jgi:hypothetical protein
MFGGALLARRESNPFWRPDQSHNRAVSAALYSLVRIAHSAPACKPFRPISAPALGSGADAGYVRTPVRARLGHQSVTFLDDPAVISKHAVHALRVGGIETDWPCAQDHQAWTTAGAPLPGAWQRHHRPP